MAKEAGIFQKAGVNVDLVWFESYTDSINALTAGQLDANSQTLNDTLTSVAGGANQVIVLVNDNSTGNDQVIADETIKSLKDLSGKKVGVEAGVVDHFLLLLALKQAGMTVKDIQLQNLETGAAAASFAAKQLDAVAVFAPFTTQALQRKGAKAIATSSDFPGAIPDHLVVSGDLVKNRPDDVQKLVNAWFMTLDYIARNHDKAVTIMAKRAGVSKAEYAAYDKGTTIFTQQGNLDAFKPGNDFKSLSFATSEITKFLLEASLVTQAPDTSHLFNSSFVEAYGKKASQ